MRLHGSQLLWLSPTWVSGYLNRMFLGPECVHHFVTCQWESAELHIKHYSTHAWLGPASASLLEVRETPRRPDRPCFVLCLTSDRDVWGSRYREEF